MADFLQNLQKQPEHIKKIIIWSVIVVVGAGLFFWWVGRVKESVNRLKNAGVANKIDFTPLEKQLKEAPGDYPKAGEALENLKNIEAEILKQGGSFVATEDAFPNQESQQ